MAELKPGAPVVLGRRVVGETKEILLEEGTPVAILAFEDDLQGELREDTRFVVRSVNRWLPGNVGIRLESKGAGGKQLQDGAMVDLEMGPMPGFPTGFPVLLALVVVVIAAAGALFVFLRSILVFIIGAAGIFALIAYFASSHG